MPGTHVSLSPCWTSDNGGPDLLGIQVTPDRVDVSDGPRRLAVIAEVADTGGPGPASGVRSVRVVAGTGGYGSFDVVTDLHAAADGSWRGEFHVPSGMHGTFDVSLVRVTDRTGHWREYELEELQALGFSPTFLVVGPRDRAAPRVRNVRLGTRTPDVRSKEALIPVRVRAVDDLGVAGVLVRATHAASGFDPTKDTLVRRAGSARDGVWTGALRLRRGVRPGIWNVQVTVLDNDDHRNIVKAPELAAQGLPDSLTVRSVRDAKAPDIELVSVSPEHADTRAGDADVRVRVRAADRGVGLERVVARLSITYPDDEGARAFYDIARGQLALVKGRVWEGSLVISDCEPQFGVLQQSIYTVHLFLEAKDRARNTRRVRPQPVLDLVAPDTVRPWAFGPDGRVPTSGPVTVHFEEEIVGLTAPQIQPYYWPYGSADPPTVPAVWSCADRSGAAVSCDEGPVGSATFSPTEPFERETPYMVVPNPEHVLSALDAAGNPALPAFFFTR